MATESFFMDLDLSTEEAVANFERAIEILEKRGPIKIPKHPEFCILEGEQLKESFRKAGYHVKDDQA